MSITEADEAATSKERALANYRQMKIAYYIGWESLGVADMYERACLDMGLGKEVSAIDRELAQMYRRKA